MDKEFSLIIKYFLEYAHQFLEIPNLFMFLARGSIYKVSGGGSPQGVMANVLDCNIVHKSRCTIKFTFRLILLEKTWTLYGLYSTSAVLLQGWLWH